MTWIPIIPQENAEGDLRRAYQDVYALYPADYAVSVSCDGALADSVVAAHSLIPQALRHSMSAFGVLLSAELPLTRRQHEMIATVVSALNGCFY